MIRAKPHTRLAAIDIASRQSRPPVLPLVLATPVAHAAAPFEPERLLMTTTANTFADLGVSAPLVRTLTAAGLTSPFPIQAATLPDTLAGRDVLGRGKTGSGKTLAFSIPLVSRLAGRARQASRPAGLVLAPTRELATQITATLQPLAEVCGRRAVSTQLASNSGA
jgi:superfamily II DNA/RNA helicase